MKSTYIREILASHFDPEQGTPYWLERQETLGFDVVAEITTRDDFYRLGVMEIAALRTRPLQDFIPRRFHGELSELLLSETGGTTGEPCRRVFSPAEFDKAFVQPWLTAVEKHGFPRQGTWLFVGPGGPHIIDRSARAMARAVGSLEPFSVDCDVRWIKRQAPGSLGFKLYMDHVLSQAMNVINHQQIDTLFTTPPLLLELARRMDDTQRGRIKGIHTGGLRLKAENRPGLQQFFPQAVILPGYGNSLFGVTFPVLGEKGGEDVFAAGDDSLWLQLAPVAATPHEGQDLRRVVAPGERGRVILHRLDPTFLIINLPERDTAVAKAMAGTEMGLVDIAPLEFATPQDRQGVY
jgi:hypothetical protein